MAEVVVFHHALGLADPVRRFANALRDSGHTVHTPDLFDGRTFDTIEDGMAHAEEIGFPMAVVDRARAAVEPLPNEVVYVGFSLGVLSAQSLAQTRPGARGAVLCYSALPLGEWGENWPAEVAGRRAAAAAHPGRGRGLRAPRRDSPSEGTPSSSSSSIPAPSTISPSTTIKRLSAGCNACSRSSPRDSGRRFGLAVHFTTFPNTRRRRVSSSCLRSGRA